MKKKGKTFLDFASENWESISHLIVLFLLFAALIVQSILNNCK